MIDLSSWPHRWYGRWKEEVSAQSVVDFPSVREVTGYDGWTDSELEKITEYLGSGPIAIVGMGVLKSVFDNTKIIGTRSWRTDSTWLWTDTLPYYLQVHKVRLPPAFVQHIRSLQYKVPPVDDEDLRNAGNLLST